MVARSRARWLAPIALAAAIAGTYLVVHASLNSKHAIDQSHTVRHLSTAQRKFARARFYTVQQGDSLTAIATKTGVPLTRLEDLNPGVDPNSLQTGQQLRIRR